MKNTTKEIGYQGENLTWTAKKSESIRFYRFFLLRRDNPEMDEHSCLKYAHELYSDLGLTLKRRIIPNPHNQRTDEEIFGKSKLHW